LVNIKYFHRKRRVTFIFSRVIVGLKMDKVIKGIVEQAKKDTLVLAVALFGSYARKERHNDIDVCIFLKRGKYSAKQLSQKKLEYTSENEKYDIQIFQQLPLYIQERIMKEGKFIYGEGSMELYDICFEMLRNLEHYKPFYKEYLEVVANG